MTSPSGTPDDYSAPRRTPPAREFDALAELFLGDSEGTLGAIPFPRDRHEPPQPLTMATPAPSQQIPQRSGAPEIEVLLMGHLPVRSGPWALQYAASVARHDHISVALVRMSPSDAGETSRVTIDVLGAQPAWTGDRNPSFAEAMAHARASAQRWIVLVGELDEADLATISGIDSMTVLSGANEAAVVDAYRMLKALAHQDDTEEACTVRVAIMGADDVRAEAAGRKLQHGARTFLNLDIELAPPLGKMGPTGSTSLYRGDAPLGVEDLIALMRRTDAPPVMTTAAPKPAVTIAEPKAAAPMHASSLVAMVEGLTPLDIECPAAPSVQLARNASGQLHVLGEGEHALQELSQAAAWAVMHRTLIARATGAALRDGEVAQHLFVREAKSVRWLLDSTVHVHVLTRALVRGEAVTVACPLN